MGAGIAVVGNVDLWYADLYGVMSAAYRISAIIKDRTAALKIAYHLRRIDSVLTKMFKEIHAAIERNPKAGVVRPAEVQEALQALDKLHRVLARLLHISKAARLTNNSLMAQSLHNIANWNEEVAELIEVVQLGLHPEVPEALYQRAKTERERGEVFDLSEV